MKRVFLPVMVCFAAAMTFIIVDSLAQLPAYAQGEPDLPFKVVFDKDKNVEKLDQGEQLMLKVKFEIQRTGRGKEKPGAEYWVVVKEDGKEQRRVPVPKERKTEDLAVVLAMDTSGSMEGARILQAKKAAGVFFDKVPESADAGLVLFSHLLYDQSPPPSPRPLLLKKVAQARAKGGTAYLDAADLGVEMVAKSDKQRVVVVMTDGVDLNSTRRQQDVISAAVTNNVRVYTIGIGKPGKGEAVSTVLALDRSGSMKQRANVAEKNSKIEALKKAAQGFVNIISNNKRCAVMKFSSSPDMPSAFSNDKAELSKLIQEMKADGETCIYDAVYEAILTLAADGHPGRHAVVALTDGIDNKSRHRVEEVIQLAKDTGTPLFVLGFGLPGELDIDSMKRLADSSPGGKFFHADSTGKLIELFEELSNKIHDDGIDENALRALAESTGGRYYPAEDVDKLDMILKQVSEEIKDKSILVTFPSFRQVRDAVPRVVSLEIVEKIGNEERTVSKQEGSAHLRGVVIAQMDHFVYLIFLALIGALIALPGLLRRRQAS